MENLRVGVVGVGYLGRFHARIFAEMPGVDLVGVADTDPNTAEVVGERHGCAWYTDPEALIGKTDAVSIVVPTSAHREVAIPYLENGIHMMLEKPVAGSLEDARARGRDHATNH